MSIPRPDAGPVRGAAGRSRALALAAVIVLFVLPLALRLRPLAHGLPRNYVPDTHMVRAALGMARDRDFVPPVGRYTSYPYLVPYLLLPIYAGHFACGLASGAWSSALEYGEAVSAEPTGVHLLARLLVALFGAATPWVVFRTARAAGLRGGAWIAAWLVGTGLLHVHFSVQDRPWVPMVFFLALAGWSAVLYARDGRARNLVWAGAAAGLAGASHQAGLLALGIPGLAWLFGLLERRDLRRSVARGIACVAAFGVIALLLGHPYRLIHGATPEEAVVGGDAGDLSIGGQSHDFGFRAASLAHLSRAFVGYEPALLVLALPGLVFALRSRAARPVAVFALCWAAYFLPQKNDHVRYLLPLSVLLALPAGFAAEAWLRRGRGAVLALAPLLALPLVQALRLGHVLSQDDMRALAERVVPAHLPAGARLAVDRYGPEFDPSKESLELLARLREAKGDTLSTREALRARRLAEGGAVEPGLDLVHVRELFDFDERNGTVRVAAAFAGDRARPADEGDSLDELRAELDELGVTHLLLVARAPAAAEGSLLAGLVRERRPLVVLSPARGSTTAGEARLPTEMDFPLTALWRVNRPGPWMALYALR